MLRCPMAPGSRCRVLAAFASLLLLGGAGCGPGDQEVETEATRLVDAPDGVPIAYRVVGSGEPTLVFVHGWSCDRTYWDEQVPYFARSHRVVTVDLAGHGESGLGREDWSIGAFAEDVIAVAEAVELEEIVLIGHSMGGPVVAETARRLPDRVVAVVGADTYFDSWARASQQDWTPFVEALRDDFRGTTEKWVPEVMFHDDTDTAFALRITRDMASAPQKAGVGAMEGLYVWLESNFPQILDEVRAPLGIVQSELNRENLYLSVVDTAGDRSGLPPVRVVPSTGHFLMLERPGEFNRALEAMIDDLGGR